MLAGGRSCCSGRAWPVFHTWRLSVVAVVLFLLILTARNLAPARAPQPACPTLPALPTRPPTDQLRLLLHPNAVSQSRIDSAFDRKLTELHCQATRCTQGGCDRLALSQEAMEAGDAAFKSFDMEAAVAAYMVAFTPDGNPSDLGQTELEEHARLVSAFHFVEALSAVQLFWAADVLAARLLELVSWSSLYELRAHGDEHFRRYPLALENMQSCLRQVGSQCSGTGIPPRGLSLTLDDRSLEIWLAKSETWVKAVPTDVVLESLEVKTDECSTVPVKKVAGSICFKHGDKKETWLLPHVLPEPGAPVSPLCNSSERKLSVRRQPTYHDRKLEMFKSEIADRSKDTSATIYETVYKPRLYSAGPVGLKIHQADQGEEIQQFFKSQGYVVVGNGIPQGWDTMMRDYVLRFRTKISTKAWSVGPNFRRHTNKYIKKPGFRTNLGLSLEEGTPSGKTVGQVFAEMFRSVPALQELLPSDALVTELGAFVVEPGAEHQIIHQDINYVKGQAKPRALFVQLGPAEVGQGNLRVWPGTHPQPKLRPIDDDKADRETNLESVRYNSGTKRGFQGIEIAPIESRSIIVYDGSMFHQGTRNVHREPRVILYLSVVFGEKAHKFADAWTISLIPEYKKKRLTVKDLVRYRLPSERAWMSMDEHTCNA